MVEKRRATRIKVSLEPGADSRRAGLNGAWLLLDELRDWLGGVHHVAMHVYTLGVLLKTKLCWSRLS